MRENIINFGYDWIRGLRRSCAGVALEGQVKGDDTCLASSTLLANENDKGRFLLFRLNIPFPLLLSVLTEHNHYQNKWRNISKIQF